MMYAFAALMLLVVGCAPSSEMVQHGNQKILFTQTQNQWADNVILVTPCKVALMNGQCDPDGPTQMSTASGKLPGVVSGTGGAVTSALIVRDGIIKGKSNVTQKNQTDIRASTVNPK